MRRISLFFALFAAAIIAISCTSTLPTRFERFVDRVEKNAASYDEDDWQKVSDQFTKLTYQYEKVQDRLSKEDCKRINKAIGRYRVLVIKSGVKNAINSFKKAMEELPSTLQGIIDGVGSFLDEMQKITQ